MTFYDLNPGDKIMIKQSEWRVNIFHRDISKEIFEVNHLKINDSFPEAIVQGVIRNTQKDINGKEFVTSEHKFPYGVSPQEIILVEHKDRNNKRWNWIVNRIGIGTNYPTLYYSGIAENEYAKFNWQSWGNDDYYHCPFCDKKLNSVKSIEDTKPEEGAKLTLKDCTCEAWKARKEKYNKYVKTKAKLEKLENDILEEARLTPIER